MYSVYRSEDYNEHSRGIVGPLRSLGFCTGDFDPNVEIFKWTDFAAPVYSGNKVTLVMELRGGGIQFASKILEFTKDGTAWAVGYSDHKYEKAFAIRLDDRRLKILAIGVMVLELRMPVVRPKPIFPEDDAWLQLAKTSAPAFREWRKHGFLSKRRLRVDNDHLTIHHIRSLIRCPLSFS